MGPTTEEASTDSRQSTFFHMSFTVTAKTLGQDAAEWTKGVADSLEKYISKNCVEGIVVRSYHDTTLQLEAAFLFSENLLGGALRNRLRTETIKNSVKRYGFTTCDWKLGARILGSKAEWHHASYEDLRARTQGP